MDKLKSFFISFIIFYFSVFYYQNIHALEEDKQNIRPAVSVETIKISYSSINDTIEIVGTLTPKFQAEVKAEYAATVSKIYVNEWVKVKKGNKLVKLDNREITTFLNRTQAAVEMANANLLQAKVAKDRSEREYNRLLKLKESGLATQQSLDEAKTEKEASIARYSASLAQLNASKEELSQVNLRLSKSEISSPIDGIVALRNVNIGDLVGEAGGNKIMFKIVDNRLLDLTVVVPSKFMAKLNVGQPLTFTTDAFQGKTFTGKVMFINPTVDDVDRSVKVIAEVENDPEILKGGLFVKGQILIGQRDNIIQVPRSIFLNWDVVNQKAEVFIVQNDSAKLKNVKTGVVNGDMVEIISGISINEEVINQGGFNIKDGDKIKVNRSN